jgi:dsRNA-specific ribonuclease
VSSYLTLASCIRLIRHNTTSSASRLTPRQADAEASENFIAQATSKSPSQLLQQPERDTHIYDNNPAIQFSTQSISALHARIGLPSSFPLATLERCLTDPSTQTDHTLHNEALSVVGAGLLEYYVTEYLCVRWPRLTIKTQGAALWAYTGESALARIAKEWGVESQSTEDKKRLGKGKQKNVDSETPRLLVRPPIKEDGKEAEVGHEMEWEVREQMRMGWVDRNGKSLGEWDDVNRYQLLALQRFVQALVGGVYVHSVLPRSLYPPLSRHPIISSPLQPVSSSQFSCCSFSNFLGHHNHRIIHKSPLPNPHPPTPLNPLQPPFPLPTRHPPLRKTQNPPPHIPSPRRKRSLHPFPNLRRRRLFRARETRGRSGRKYEGGESTG